MPENDIHTMPPSELEPRHPLQQWIAVLAASLIAPCWSVMAALRTSLDSEPIYNTQSGALGYLAGFFVYFFVWFPISAFTLAAVRFCEKRFTKPALIYACSIVPAVIGGALYNMVWIFFISMPHSGSIRDRPFPYNSLTFPFWHSLLLGAYVSCSARNVERTKRLQWGIIAISFGLIAANFGLSFLALR